MNLNKKEMKLYNLKHERTNLILNDSYGVGLDGNIGKPGLVDFLSNSKKPHGYFNYFECFTVNGTSYDLYVTDYNINSEGICTRDSIKAYWHGSNAANTKITELYFVTYDIAAKIKELNKKITRLEITLNF